MDLEIKLNSLVEEFILMPEALYINACKINKLEEKYEASKASLEEYSGKLSNDMALNPEKFGFPLGTDVNRFRILGKVYSTEQYQKLKRTMLYYDIRLKQSKAYQSSLKAKYDVLKCLISSNIKG